jgi:hypothetical protein
LAVASAASAGPLSIAQPTSRMPTRIAAPRVITPAHHPFVIIALPPS